MKVLLIGAGNMGGAMLEGLHVNDITVVEANRTRAQELQTRYPTICVRDSIPPLDGFTVILAIKPQSFPSLETHGEAQGVISIMAGVTLDQLKAGIHAKAYVRSMPNMAALVQKSVTTLCGDLALKTVAMEVLQTIGECFWVESEKELDIAMGLAGCTPAWIALVAEALSDGAVALGLKRELSYAMVAGVFSGVGEVLKAEHPALLKDKVMSPGGTTAAGYAKLEEGGVRDSFIQAMRASFERAKKID